MEKFTKKGLNELKKERKFDTKVERRIINDILNTGLNTSELKNYMFYKKDHVLNRLL